MNRQQISISDILNAYKIDKRIGIICNYIDSAPADADPLYIRSLSYSAKAIALAACGKKSLFICAEKDEAPYVYYDLTKIIGEEKAFLLPSSFKHRPDATAFDAQNIQLRTEAISKLLDPSVKELVLITTPQAVTEKVISSSELKQNTLNVKVGEHISLSFLTEVLYEYNFERVDFVFQPGQFSIRGSIVDVFSFSSDVPYRIDFFGDEVETIRSFDLDSQLSVEQLKNVSIVPDLSIGNTESHERTCILDAIGDDCSIWLENPEFISEIISQTYEQAIVATKTAEQLAAENSDNSIKLNINNFTTLKEWQNLLTKRRQINLITHNTPLPDNANIIDFGIKAQPLFKKNFDLLEDDIYYKSSDNYQVYVLSDNSRQLERLNAILNERKRKLKYSEVKVALHEGFVDSIGLKCLYTDHQIFERYHKYVLRNDKMRSSQQIITLIELSQLNVGDYVVHVDHGIGIFGGLMTNNINGRVSDSVRIIFANNNYILVNVQSLHRISKYRGKDGIVPKISKLGSDAWDRLKEKTKKHVKDIASELIALYAKRKEEEGFAFSPDTFLQQELEASFLYEDTPDQYKATQAIKKDMERKTPMDRLVCGDVGFGKTELAIRAAFKAVCDNKQVAILVPTTVLAFQHYNTFKSRLDGMPCKVEYLSRLRKSSEIRSVIKGISSGDINIVIGTHRLIGKDVQFKDLGLLIIDEEQRFGVGVKEKLRELKVNIDTLTLSATPIPRTLQFSLMGARDLSVLNTPPANRQPIMTEVRVYNEEAMCDAIDFETRRGGQVFIINNRISHLHDLQRVIARLRPEIRSVVAHGQMDGSELERIMLDFIDGEYDVLLATTIIESGLDIPNANTIIINNAHQFGLSELHQLRGRVGRSNKKAFCYLFAPPLASLTQEARRRLKIIGEFAELGSGFNIAMQDLDIRGTGNVLGAEQSGFISDIGYETYQKILQEALIELKQNEYKEIFEKQNDNNEAPDSAPLDIEDFLFVSDVQIETDEEAILPESYISSISERMHLYKEADNLKNEESISKFREELIDRFGELPEASENLLQIIRLRIIAQKLGIERIVLKKGKLIIHFVSDPQSAYFQSPIFGNIINWLQTNNKKASLKEENCHLSIIFRENMNILSSLETLRSLYCS